MASDIPTDEKLYQKLVSKVALRQLRSAAWSDARRQEWVRMYKIWRRIQDGIVSNDEYSIFLGYAFSVVEQINSKVTEPMLAMGVPFAVFPTQLGDGEKAENFSQICRDFYSKPNVQDSLRKSKKEMIITGNRWEVDEWLHIERKGRMWGEKDQEVESEGRDLKGGVIVRPDGTPMMMKRTVKVKAEVERTILQHYGFNTRYPSVFDMYPEPDRKTIDTGQRTDMSWLVEDQGELSLEEMAREKFVDSYGRTQPRYDLGRLLKDAGKRAQERYDKILQGKEIDDSYGPLITPLNDTGFASDWGQQDKDSIYPTEGTVDRQSSEDRDKVRVKCHREAAEILVIAQGRYIIERKRDPWHVPGLKVRIENYTTDPEFIYGPGAIQPIEDEVYELNDIHSLSMSNFYRLINKMILIREDAIVSLDDFKSRAGGKIRIAEAAGDVRGVAMDMPQNNVVNEMLAAESNTRGMIEFESSNLDGSPGVMGTKQNHKTKGGMEIIQVNTQTRFITMQAQALINEARRGLSMQNFFDQFAFEKKSYRLVREDGTTAYAKFNKDDIFTEGREFQFAVEVDPTWGNNSAQRQEAQSLFEQGVSYEQLRVATKDPSMPRLVLSEMFKRLLQKHGQRDLSRIFVMPDNSVSPEDELQILMQGGIVQCKGDLRHHVETHILQASSPNLAKAIAAQKAHPDTAKNLMLLVEQDLAQLRDFVSNPQGAAEKKLNSVRAPGVEQ